MTSPSAGLQRTGHCRRGRWRQARAARAAPSAGTAARTPSAVIRRTPPVAAPQPCLLEGWPHQRLPGHPIVRPGAAAPPGARCREWNPAVMPLLGLTCRLQGCINNYILGQVLYKSTKDMMGWRGFKLVGGDAMPHTLCVLHT